MRPDDAAAVAGAFAIGRHSHVAIVGAGGKTTLLRALWRHLTDQRLDVLATTTTKVAASEADGIRFLASRHEVGKLVGVPPGVVDDVFRGGEHDVVLVEADGARHRLVKAPAEHEPVIPSTATHVLTVISAAALGRVIEDVAFRPLRVAALSACSPYDRLTPERATRVLASERGGRKGVPPGAHHGVVVTSVDAGRREVAQDLCGLLAARGILAVVVAATATPPIA